MKRIIKKLALFILCTTLIFQSTVVTYAYTKEEVEAAKAWLAGHGYSPDAGGAAQAYQDYLNGKFGGTPTQTEEAGGNQGGDGANDANPTEEVQENADTQTGDKESPEGTNDTGTSEPTEMSETEKATEPAAESDGIKNGKESEKDAENKEFSISDKDVIVSGNTVSGANVDEAVIREIEEAMDSEVAETPENKNTLERPENAYNKEETMAQKPDRSAEVKVILACTGVAVIFVGVFVFLKYFRNKNKNR